MSELALMAVEPVPRRDWQTIVEKLFVHAGFDVQRGRNALLVWGQPRSKGRISYADGFTVRRIWLSPKRGALAVIARRLYFSGQPLTIDKRREDEIVGSNRPASASVSEQTDFLWKQIRVLCGGLEGETKPVTLEDVGAALPDARIVEIGSSHHTSPPAELNKLYKQFGFDTTPQGFSVRICPLEGVPDSTVHDFDSRIRGACKDRNVDIELGATSLEKIAQRIEQLKSTGSRAQEGRCVLFILPRKKKIPNSSTLSLFRSLEDSGVPFRRAYADDPLDFSIPDQLPSLLLAAGGKPHRSPLRVNGAPIWTVGIDLGHPLEGSTSILTLTLVDPDGLLVGAWKTKQPRDETVRLNSIEKLLSHCKALLATRESDPSIVVLRDGRHFENEDADIYREILGRKSSVFEYRKGGNPQIVADWKPLLEPRAMLVPNTSTMFLITSPPKKGKTPDINKITWDDRWNGLRLKPAETARVLTTSSASPGLGLHARHTPAAIYWADGVAGVSEKDLRFFGVSARFID